MLNILIYAVVDMCDITTSTIKALCVNKANKYVAAFAGAISSAVGVLKVLAITMDMPWYWKLSLSLFCSFCAILFVRSLEEFLNRNKKFKFELTVPAEYHNALRYDLKENCLPHQFIDNVGSNQIFYVHCTGASQIRLAKKFAEKYCGSKFNVLEVKHV